MPNNPPLMPKNFRLTETIRKAHERPRNYIPPKDRKRPDVIGRLTPPVPRKTKMKVTLPSIEWPSRKDDALTSSQEISGKLPII